MPAPGAPLARRLVLLALVLGGAGAVLVLVAILGDLRALLAPGLVALAAGFALHAYARRDPAVAAMAVGALLGAAAASTGSAARVPLGVAGVVLTLGGLAARPVRHAIARRRDRAG